ncbi:MAG: hypothetical protein QXP01_09640 [Candidatus Hadarchaeum sp.]
MDNPVDTLVQTFFNDINKRFDALDEKLYKLAEDLHEIKINMTEQQARLRQVEADCHEMSGWHSDIVAARTLREQRKWLVPQVIAICAVVSTWIALAIKFIWG